MPKAATSAAYAPRTRSTSSPSSTRGPSRQASGKRIGSPGGRFAEGSESGVYFTFDLTENRNVQYKIGVSYVSVENARANLAAENAGWDFAAVQHAAERRWNDYLGLIEAEGTNPDRTTSTAY